MAVDGPGSMPASRATAATVRSRQFQLGRAWARSAPAVMMRSRVAAARSRADRAVVPAARSVLVGHWPNDAPPLSG